MREWYYASGERQVGPVTTSEILTLRDSGTLGGSSLVWCSELVEWTRLSSVPDEFLRMPDEGRNQMQSCAKREDVAHALEQRSMAEAGHASEGISVGSTPQVFEKVARFEFTGKTGEYFRIWVVNVVLTVLTLGIYSAWAKVRTRRYFYGNTLLDGKPFDFTGNPVAILKGNLIFGGLFVAYSVAGNAYPAVAGLAAVLILLLTPWLVRKALRFRAQNTVHRNVRMHFRGKLGEAYKVFFGLLLLAVPTFGLIIPYQQFRQKRYVLGNMSWGNSAAEMRGNASFFYRTFFKWLGMVLLLVVLMVAGIAGVAGGVAGLKKAKEALAAREQAARPPVESKAKWSEQAVLGEAKTSSQRSPTEIVFHNQTGKGFRVFWVDETGALKPYGGAGDGKVLKLSTYEGHVWMVQGADGQELGRVTASLANPQWFVDGAVTRRLAATQSRERGSRTPLEERKKAVMTAVLIVVPVFYLMMFSAILYYQVRIQNYSTNTTVWSGVGRLQSCIRVRDLVWIYLTNGLAVLCSLGLLIPWVMVRMARYRASRTTLWVSGDLDGVAQMLGSSESAMGDAGADVFDLEVGF
jgi:uncharacterized membrane protein YjgN (DUF898 family)